MSILVVGEIKKGERRTALTPEAAAVLAGMNLNVAVQSSAQRAFPDSLYSDRGLPIVGTVEGYRILAGIKEMRDGTQRRMHEDQIAMCFHHAHKKQPHNREYLRVGMERRMSFCDYELLKLPDGSQPITTSVEAGMAGAVNGLSIYGRKVAEAGGTTVFSKLPRPGSFETAELLQEQFAALGQITEPIRIAIVGTGKCGQGAREVCTWLGIPEIEPSEVQSTPGPWFCVLRTPDTVERIQGGAYNKSEFRKYGAERYRNTFERFLGFIDLLVYTPYWEEHYPKLLPRDLMRSQFDRLPLVVSDVTCDLRGSLDCTQDENTVQEPVSTYFPETDTVLLGIHAGGLVVTAVDILPAQIPITCSRTVSVGLTTYLPQIAALNMDAPFDRCGADEVLSRAFITWKGELTPRYAYLAEWVH